MKFYKNLFGISATLVLLLCAGSLLSNTVAKSHEVDIAIFGGTVISTLCGIGIVVEEDHVNR